MTRDEKKRARCDGEKRDRQIAQVKSLTRRRSDIFGDKQDERTAVHESGHAVVAHAIGLEVEKMEFSQTPNDWWRARTSYALPDKSEDISNEQLEKIQLTGSAGYAAIQRLLRKPHVGLMEAGAWGDFRQSEQLMLELFRRDPARYSLSTAADRHARLSQRTAEIVEQRWDAILRLAKVFHEKRVLTGAQVRETIEKSAVNDRS